LIFGHAAQDGLRAALLAKEGMQGPAAPLEGKYGFASLYASRPHLPSLTASLGQRFHVESLGYKPYPCGVVISPAVDAAIAWHRTHGADPPSIEQVFMRVHPSAMSLGFRRHPTSVLEAKVSLFHWVSVALLRGRAGIAEGEMSTVHDPAIVGLRDVIHVESDASLTAQAASLSVVSREGLRHTVDIDHCKGSVANPMTDDDIADKFFGQAALRMTRDAAARLIDTCWHVDELEDVSAISRLCQAYETGTKH
jgi:2-methylcitrate dehydratase PrpD